MSDALTVCQGAPTIGWTPPREPGPVTFWIVASDNRDGGAVLRRTIVLR